jgi:hypothetical protein
MADQLANSGALRPDVEDRDLARDLGRAEEENALSKVILEIQEGDLLTPEELENLEF